MFGTMGLDLDSCIERVCFFVVKLFTFSLCASLQVVLFPFHPFSSLGLAVVLYSRTSLSLSLSSVNETLNDKT